MSVFIYCSPVTLLCINVLLLLLLLHTLVASLLPDEAAALVDLPKGLASPLKEDMLEPLSSAGDWTSKSLADGVRTSNSAWVCCRLGFTGTACCRKQSLPCLSDLSTCMIPGRDDVSPLFRSDGAGGGGPRNPGTGLRKVRGKTPCVNPFGPCTLGAEYHGCAMLFLLRVNDRYAAAARSAGLAQGLWHGAIL